MIVAAPLTAQDSNAFRFGAQLSLANPTGDLSDIAGLGFGVAAFGEKPLTSNFAIRGTVDYLMFGEKDEVSTTKYGVFADGIWSFNGHDVGPFALVTVGFENTTWKIDDWDDDQSGLGYGVGFGYNFTTNLGAEVKYIIGPEFEGGFSNSQIKVSATWRF